MDRRQSNSRRCEIVRQFLAGLTDDTERQICSLYQLGLYDAEVRRKLKLSRGRMEAIKLRFASELMGAGICLSRREA